MLSFAVSGKANRSFFADPIQYSGFSPGTGLRGIPSQHYSIPKLGWWRFAPWTPRSHCAGEKPDLGYAAVSDPTTETLTRYPNRARMRTNRSLDTRSRSSFRIAVTLVREVPSRLATSAFGAD